ncbi:MAG: GNAT family N-acetyltransferase [Candidatus Bathyarchaeota archaeon]|jgi:RimJ/RimL family protein N-acetyltransferase|nr:GNAT family N-acetyltransferase [Candidatus Bathyarchaeota archaeon A05DMB-5]MDH7558346.1 GNAT family N-acetyltransferase [Candidatus Bathyarchaeota archaeon]
MRSGEEIRRFKAKDGREVVLRTPKWEDLEDFLELINSLVEEGTDILRSEKVSREEEIDFLARVLSNLEKAKLFYLVAEIDGKVVAVSETNKRDGYEKHVGVIGIAIKKCFRDVGIGTEMMKTLIEQAEKMELKVLTLSAFAINKRAIHVYEKVGFAKTGVIPKKRFKDGKYVDEIIMTRLLE